MAIARKYVPFTPFDGELAKSTIAIVSAELGDLTYRLFAEDVDSSDLKVTHHHYDHSDADQDINVVFPIDVLRDLQTDGFIRDVVSGRDVNNRDRYLIRGQLLFQPNDNLSARIIGDFAKHTGLPIFAWDGKALVLRYGDADEATGSLRVSYALTDLAGVKDEAVDDGGVLQDGTDMYAALPYEGGALFAPLSNEPSNFTRRSARNWL